MAEFCLSCWNKLNDCNETEFDWVLSAEPDLCEGCGQWCPVIVRPRRCKLFYLLTLPIRKRLG